MMTLGYASWTVLISSRSIWEILIWRRSRSTPWSCLSIVRTLSPRLTSESAFFRIVSAWFATARSSWSASISAWPTTTFISLRRSWRRIRFITCRRCSKWCWSVTSRAVRINPSTAGRDVFSRIVTSNIFQPSVAVFSRQCWTERVPVSLALSSALCTVSSSSGCATLRMESASAIRGRSSVGESGTALI